MKIDVLNCSCEIYCISGNVAAREVRKQREAAVRKRNRSVISICNSRCDVRMLAGAHQLCTVTMMDAGECPNFPPKYSSVKICLLSFLYEPIAESWRQQKMRNWASSIDKANKDKNKGESGVRNKVAESVRSRKKSFREVVKGE